jgi:hypothetical protein
LLLHGWVNEYSIPAIKGKNTGEVYKRTNGVHLIFLTACMALLWAINLKNIQ